MEKVTNQSATIASQALTEQQHFWLKHYQSCLGSEKSMAEYAREHGLAVKSFYYWKTRLLRLGAITSDTQPKPPVFHKVRTQASPALKVACRIRFANGIECKLSLLAETGLEQLLVTVSRLQPS